MVDEMLIITTFKIRTIKRISMNLPILRQYYDAADIAASVLSVGHVKPLKEEEQN